VSGGAVYVGNSRLGNDPARNAKPGEHVWVVCGAWRVLDPAAMMKPGAQVLLDHESLVSLTSVGCYVCEREWSKELQARPCPGDPLAGPPVNPLIRRPT
jgi:hypothetical protein